MSEAAGTPPTAEPNEAGLDLTAMLPEEEAVSVVKPPIGHGSDSGIDLSAVEVVEEPAGPHPLSAGGAAVSDSSIDLSGVEVVDVESPKSWRRSTSSIRAWTCPAWRSWTSRRRPSRSRKPSFGPFPTREST